MLTRQEAEDLARAVDVITGAMVPIPSSVIDEARGVLFDLPVAPEDGQYVIGYRRMKRCLEVLCIAAGIELPERDLPF